MIKSEIYETARRMLELAEAHASAMERRADALREETDEVNAWLPEIDARWRRELETVAEQARANANALDKLVSDIEESGRIWQREQRTTLLIAGGKARYCVVFADGTDAMVWATSESAAEATAKMQCGGPRAIVRTIRYQIQSVGVDDFFSL